MESQTVVEDTKIEITYFLLNVTKINGSSSYPLIHTKHGESVVGCDLPVAGVLGMVADSPSNNEWAKSSLHPPAAAHTRNKL
jgi:hypothetical protein